MQERRAFVAPLSDADGSPTPPSGSPRLPGRRRLVVTACSALVVVAVDQVTKSLAESHLHGPVHLIGPFGFALTFNSGAAFSLFTGSAGVLFVVALALIGGLGFAAWHSSSLPMSVALGLVLGGALGNVTDRLLRGHHRSVVDFITLTHWPTFNVADACITLGALAAVLLTLLHHPSARTGR